MWTVLKFCILIIGWEGGDEWIRLQFRIYLQALLATVKYGGTEAER